jgi:hypothetical protein
MYESTPADFLGDPIEEESSEDLPVFDEEEMTAIAGHAFDGLSRGMHLEIKNLENRLSVTYKGFPVYLEESGDLQRYVPFQEWEDQIERLYKVAAKLRKEDKKVKKGMKEQVAERAKNKWFRRMFEKWGFQ